MISMLFNIHILVRNRWASEVLNSSLDDKFLLLSETKKREKDNEEKHTWGLSTQNCQPLL